MSVNINTYSLASLPDVKSFMGMTGTTSEIDDLLAELINRYSTLFESYMGKNVLSREHTEYYDGNNSNMLITRQYPITTISGIWNDSDWEWGSATEIDSTSYRASESAIGVINFKSTVFGNYDQNIKIIYTAGFSSVPEDIKHACIKEVARSYKNRQEIGVTSKTLTDGTVSFSAQGLLVETTLVLDMYRKLWVI